MRDFLSLAVLSLIISSKVLGVMLILLGLVWGFGTVLLVVGFASMTDPSLPEAIQWEEFWGRVTSRDGLESLGIGLGVGLILAMIGGGIFKVPVLKRWPGPVIKAREEEIG